MRKTTVLGILGIFLCMPVMLFAQLSVSIQMDPNPSPFISDWKSDPNTVRLIVTNPTGKSHSVRFKGYIEGDARGRVAETKLDGSIPPVDISPGVSILTATDAHILDKDAVRYVGPTRQEVIQSGRLPDDNFRICVQVVSYDSPHSPLSPEACSRFTVRRLSPPSLIAPADKSTIKAAPTFQWSHVAMGRGNFARYELRLIELSPGQQSIVNAMETGIPLLVRESSLPMYQFLPSDPKLQNGKTYAWRVRAFDPQNKFTFTSDGKSEIRTFTYSSAKLTVVKDVTKKKKTTGMNIGTSPNFVFTQLTRIRGTLRTTFYKNSIPTPRSIIYKSSKGKPPLSESNQPQPGGGQVIKSGISLKTTPHLQTNVGLKKNLPLGGLHLKLYLRTKTNPICGYYPFTASGKTYEAEKLIATTTTNPDGTFEFMFFAKDSTGRILKNALIQCGSNEFVNSLTGDLYRYYQIMVNDPHLLSPSDEFKVQPGELFDVGTLYSLVRSYSVTVSVKDKVKGSQLPNMDVRIVRTTRPYDVPPEEGTLKPYQSVDDIFFLKKAKAEVIARGKTNAEGKTTLKYMVKNVGGSDRYHLLVSSPEEGVYYYHTLWRTFKFGFLMDEKDEAGHGMSFDAAIINEGYDPAIMHVTVLAEVKPHKPRIAGRVYRSDNTLQAVKNAKVTLYGFSFGPWELRTTMTNDSGGFVFDNLDPTGDSPEAKAIFYFIRVEKYGFKKYQSDAIFVELGQQYYTTIQLEPALTVKGRIVDELGRPVAAEVRIGQGEWVHTVKKIKPKKTGALRYLKKPAPNKLVIKSSSAGMLKNKKLQIVQAIPVVFEYDEEFTTPAVMGLQWLYVLPDNQSLYYPETLLVLLPEDAENIGAFTVFIKQHRLAVQAVTMTPKTSKSWKAKSSPNKYIPGTSVKKTIQGAVIRVNDAEPDSVDADGVAYFVWTSPSDNAIVRVRGPDNSDYVEKIVSTVVDESKSWTFLEVPLKLGGALSGTVKVGTVPIPGARVALYDNPADASPLQTTTDSDGKYTIHGIPVGTHVFKAAKSKSQYIGDTAQAAIF
ncbi:MAG: carboxypeptidase regulatory-like domain-containing protein, partial [Chlorobi bacterium]|nr:carboxypeptidase regulatory-like domain-containing protein [Chlorobiota bacterium]